MVVAEAPRATAIVRFTPAAAPTLIVTNWKGSRSVRDCVRLLSSPHSAAAAAINTTPLTWSAPDAGFVARASCWKDRGEGQKRSEVEQAGQQLW